MAIAPSSVPDAVLLANVVFAALRGRHARFAESEGRALRYVDAVAPFAALPADAAQQDWRDLAALACRTGTVALHRMPGDVPDGWATEHNLDVHVMNVFPFSGAGLTIGDEDPEIVPLTAEDVPDMLDLTARTEPGPFRDRTIELGGYVGIRRGGVLAAMAGRRMSAPGHDSPGWTEVSAVCTDPAFRGQGLATRLIRAVAAGIRAQGDEVFLHVRDSNTGAIALYERIGFTRLAPVAVTVLSPRVD